MNYEDFNNKLQKRSAIDKYWNYFISIGAILFGLYCLYKTHTIEFIDAYKAKHNKEYPILAAYLITTGLTSLGLYGFWRIPKTYKVTKIKAEHSAEQKVQILLEKQDGERLETFDPELNS